MDEGEKDKIIHSNQPSEPCENQLDVAGTAKPTPDQPNPEIETRADEITADQIDDDTEETETIVELY